MFSHDLSENRFHSGMLEPLPRLDLADFDRGRRRARDLVGNVLALDAFLVASVSTIAPIMATSSTSPAAWKK